MTARRSKTSRAPRRAYDGRTEYYRLDDDETHLTPDAPPDFHVFAMMESHVPPRLWIGVTNDPDHRFSLKDPRAYTISWAFIGGTTLRRLVEDLRKYYEHYDRMRQDGAE